MTAPDLAALVRTYLAAKDALFLGTDWLDGRRLWDAWHRADAELRRAVTEQPKPPNGEP